MGRGILVALLLWPAVAGAQLLVAAEGEPSVVAARYSFDKSGGDWAVPANAPPATVACRGDFRSGACGPTTFAVTGSPGLASTYWRPDGGVAGVGVAFDGVDLMSAGDVFDPAGSFTECVQFTPTALPAIQWISRKDGGGGQTRGHLFYLSGASLRLFVASSNADITQITCGSVAIGQQATACVTYEFIAPGAVNKLRCNLNGAAPAEVTTAVGPVQNTALALTLGLQATMVLERFDAWDGWHASAADLARMVDRMRAHLGTLGEPATVTRSTPESVTLPTGDGPFVTSVPANTLGIGPSGAQVFGARTSRILWNQALDNAVWVKRGTAACVPSPVAAPDGSMTAWRCTVGACFTNDIYQLTTGHAANAVLGFSTWFRQVTETGTVRLTNAQTDTLGRRDVNLAGLSSNWQRSVAGDTTAWAATAGGLAGLLMCSTTSALLAFDFWSPWQQEGALGPDAEVAGSALPLAGTKLDLAIPAGSKWLAYVLSGTRYALDVSALASPLSVGVGHTLSISGNLKAAVFCTSADSVSCQ